MLLTLKSNVNTQSPLIYFGGSVVVPAAGGQVLVPRDFAIAVLQDSNFTTDVLANNVIVNNGFGDLSPQGGIDLIKFFAQFAFQPSAVTPIYESALINVTQSTTTAAASCVWAMTNNAGSQINVMIEQIKLIASYSGTAVLQSAQLLRYRLARFSGGTPTTGTSVPIVKHNSSGLSSPVTDCRFLDTGLSMTGISVDNPFDVVSVPNVQGALVSYAWVGAMRLAPGEGMGIFLDQTAATNQGITGRATWSKR